MRQKRGRGRLTKKRLYEEVIAGSALKQLSTISKKYPMSDETAKVVVHSVTVLQARRDGMEDR